MHYHNRIAIFGTHDANTLAQLDDVATRASRVSIMADGHLGYVMPVGGVAAYPNQVSVAGVGFDIGCGNTAVKTNYPATDLRLHRHAIADEIASTISFGIGQSNRCAVLPDGGGIFEHPWWDEISRNSIERGTYVQRARAQLGTIGSGNHYVDIFTDEDDCVWIGVHFGSRGFGWKHAMGTMALAQGMKYTDKVKEAETLLDLDTPLGDFYWTGKELASEYARIGRAWVCDKVRSILGDHVMIVDTVENNHNDAWKESHYIPTDEPGNTGWSLQSVVVVRKGATPAWAGQRGFIGGSMGDNAVIVEGRVPESMDAKRMAEATMWSTVHGAGRVMSRTKAKGKYHRRTGECKTPGLISPQMMYGWLQKEDVVLRGGGLDEAPQAYRRLPDVLAVHADTINVLHTLTPQIVVMAGDTEYDPYK